MSVATETLFRDESQFSSNMKLDKLARAYRDTAMTKPAHVTLVGCVTRNSMVGNEVDAIIKAMVEQMVDARDRLIFFGVPKPAISGHLPLRPVPIVQNVVIGTVLDTALPPPLPGARTGVPGKIDPESAVSGKFVIDPFSESEDKRQSHHVATQIEVTIWEGMHKKPPIKIAATLNVTQDGIHEVGAEIEMLKLTLKNKWLGGAITNVEVSLKLEGKHDFDKQKVERLFGKWSADFKAGLSFVIKLPIKIKVELTLGVDLQGKPTPGVQFIIFEF